MKSHRLALPLLLALCLGPGIIAAQVTASPLPASAVSRFRPLLSPSLIPHLEGDFQLEDNQAFVLKGAGFPEFMILPTRFRSSSEDAPSPASHCGLFLISGTATVSFLGTLGFGQREPELCDGLLGVGFMAAHSGPPRIILLYNGGSFNSPGKDPVILDWNAATHRYASNDRIVDRLGNLGTVPAIKARLKALAASK